MHAIADAAQSLGTIVGGKDYYRHTHHRHQHHCDRYPELRRYVLQQTSHQHGKVAVGPEYSIIVKSQGNHEPLLSRRLP